MNAYFSLLLLYTVLVGCVFNLKSESPALFIKNHVNKTYQVDHFLSDTNKILKFVALDIQQSLKNETIQKSEFDELHNYYIEYNGQNCIIERKQLLFGNLNNDSIKDFAIRTIYGLTRGNLFIIEWRIYVSQNNTWKVIQSNIGGGNTSAMETIIALNRGVIKTHYQKFDESTFSLSDEIQIKEYQLKGTNLLEKVRYTIIKEKKN